MKKLKDQILSRTVGLYINLLSYITPDKAFKLAYYFFSTPRSGRLHPEQLPAILQQAQKEILEINGHRVQTYLWPGSQQTVLLLHGWESNAARWEHLIPILQAKGSTVIALDAPAHGLTSGKEFNVPLYANFVEAVVQKHQPNYIIGHSLGGITAGFHYHKHQNKYLDKMVLLGAPSDFDIILNNYLKMLGLNERIKKAFYDYTFERFQISIDDFSGKSFLQSLQQEGIIIHDREDTVVLFDEAEKLSESWKTAQLIATSGLGHSLHDENVNQRIASFLFGA